MHLKIVRKKKKKCGKPFMLIRGDVLFTPINDICPKCQCKYIKPTMTDILTSKRKWRDA